MTIIEITVIDPGVGEEYGFFGKPVARVEVRGMTAEEIEAEKAEMIRLFGEHVRIIEVEEV